MSLPCAELIFSPDPVTPEELAELRSGSKSPFASSFNSPPAASLTGSGFARASPPLNENQARIANENQARIEDESQPRHVAFDHPSPEKRRSLLKGKMLEVDLPTGFTVQVSLLAVALSAATLCAHLSSALGRTASHPDRARIEQELYPRSFPCPIPSSSLSRANSCCRTSSSSSPAASSSFCRADPEAFLPSQRGCWTGTTILPSRRGPGPGRRLRPSLR